MKIIWIFFSRKYGDINWYEKIYYFACTISKKNFNYSAESTLLREDTHIFFAIGVKRIAYILFSQVYIITQPRTIQYLEILWFQVPEFSMVFFSGKMMEAPTIYIWSQPPLRGVNSFNTTGSLSRASSIYTAGTINTALTIKRAQLIRLQECVLKCNFFLILLHTRELKIPIAHFPCCGKWACCIKRV